MDEKILQPSRTFIDLRGKIAYGDSSQSWSNIRLKRDIVNEFPELKNKKASFSYRMQFYRSYNDLVQAIKLRILLGFLLCF